MRSSKVLVRLGAAVAAVLATFAMATPAFANDTVTTASPHIGDICTVPQYTTGCDGSASFVKYGEHLYVWDNVADGHSVLVIYFREDTCGVFNCQENHVWNHYGAGTRVDHNMAMDEGTWIQYWVCLGEYSTKAYWGCSPHSYEQA